jgi:uncharacterized membrane protein YoaK (UPF0700 family)
MQINSSLFGLFMLVMMVVVGVMAYRLGRRKSERPALITFLCMLLCLFPPFAILALLILALRRDRPARA